MPTQQALERLTAAIGILRNVRTDIQGDVPRRFLEKLDGVMSGIKSAIGDLTPDE